MGVSWYFFGVVFVILSVLYLHPSIVCCYSCSMPHFHVVCLMLLCILPYLCFYFVSRLDVSWFGITLTTITPICISTRSCLFVTSSSQERFLMGLGIPVGRTEGNHRVTGTTEQVQFAV